MFLSVNLLRFSRKSLNYAIMHHMVECLKSIYIAELIYTWKFGFQVPACKAPYSGYSLSLQLSGKIIHIA